MSVLATVVDWSALGQTVLAALLSGVGVAFTFSLGILGVARFTDGSRELGLLGTIAFGAAGAVWHGRDRRRDRLRRHRHDLGLVPPEPERA